MAAASGEREEPKAKSERLTVALVLDRPINAANEDKLARVVKRLADAGAGHLTLICEGPLHPANWALDLALARRADVAGQTAEHFASSGFTLTLLPEGSGRSVVAAAARLHAKDAAEPISIEAFNARVQEIAGPAPDLIIVTGGTPNLRGSLTWHAAYGEFVFLARSWTELASADLDRALKEFAARGRRFGGIA